jgi:hypothetical protein
MAMQMRRPKGGLTLSQWPSEAKFVTVRIGQVKEPLAPFGIARRRLWSVAGRNYSRVEAVDVGMVEDDTSPPGPISLRGLCDEVEKAGSSPKTCKPGFIATMNDFKSQHAIEGDGLPHVVGGQRDRTDALDHRGTAPFSSLIEAHSRCAPKVKSGVRIVRALCYFQRSHKFVSAAFKDMSTTIRIRFGRGILDVQLPRLLGNQVGHQRDPKWGYDSAWRFFGLARRGTADLIAADFVGEADTSRFDGRLASDASRVRGLSRRRQQAPERSRDRSRITS